MALEIEARKPGGFLQRFSSGGVGSRTAGARALGTQGTVRAAARARELGTQGTAHAAAGVRLVKRAANVAKETVGPAGMQILGTTAGLVEKALGPLAPTLTKGFALHEIVPPPGRRSVHFYRSNQPTRREHIEEIIAAAAAHGVTDLRKVKILNFRWEKSNTRRLVSEYNASVGIPDSAGITVGEVPIPDNGPPSPYIYNLGWNRVLEKVRQADMMLDDPNLSFVVFHCQMGGTRTGQMVATLVRIMRDGLSGEEAVAEADKMGLNMPWARAFIRRFAVDYEAGKLWRKPGDHESSPSFSNAHVAAAPRAAAMAGASHDAAR